MNCSYIGGNPKHYHRLVTQSMESFEDLNYTLENKSLLAKGKNKFEPFIIGINATFNSLSLLRGMISLAGKV